MARDAGGHERLVQRLFEVGHFQVVVAHREAVFHDHVAGQGHESTLDWEDLSLGLKFPDAVKEELDFLPYDGLQVDDPGPREQRVQCTTSNSMQLVRACGEDGRVAAKAT